MEDLDSMGLREGGEPVEFAQNTLPLTVTKASPFWCSAGNRSRSATTVALVLQ